MLALTFKASIKGWKRCVIQVAYGKSTDSVDHT